MNIKPGNIISVPNEGELPGDFYNGDKLVVVSVDGCNVNFRVYKAQLPTRIGSECSVPTYICAGLISRGALSVS